MKLRFSIYFICILLFFSCKNNDNEMFEQEEYESWPKVNTDSIFINLDKKKIEDKAAQVDKIFIKLKKKTSFNGVMLYAEKGRVVLEKSYGVSNLRTQKGQLKNDDVFQLSSVSKMFTAEAIMILHNRGLIDYDADIQTYIPEFPYEGITTRMLLTHRSGLSRYESLADEHWPDKRKFFTNDDLVEYYVKYKPDPYTTPDRTFHYCNVNYALLANLVERVTGTSFVDFMQHEIFDVIGMKKSFIYDAPKDEDMPTYLPYECVQGYYLGRRRPRQAENEYLNGVKGDKIMFSNVEDMYRFWIAVDYGLLVPDSIQAEAFKPGSPIRKKKQDNYGFGWRMTYKHPDCVYHFGWWKGYRSFYMRNNKEDRVLIVLTNTDRGPNADEFWKLLEDNTSSLAPSSTNIHYIEYEEGLRFPYSSYLLRE
ncbi:MAG: serine hydrolase domain-containing protein [Bacteroidia bacterium]|nr:serine hydrolase domain-containing protein [Bacteroidia bacterium]